MERNRKIVVLGDTHSGKSTFLDQLDTDYHCGHIFVRANCCFLDTQINEHHKLFYYFENAAFFVIVINPLQDIERYLGMLQALKYFPFIGGNALLVLTHRDEHVDFELYERLRKYYPDHILAYCGLGQLGQDKVEEWLYTVVFCEQLA